MESFNSQYMLINSSFHFVVKAFTIFLQCKNIHNAISRLNILNFVLARKPFSSSSLFFLYLSRYFSMMETLFFTLQRSEMHKFFDKITFFCLLKKIHIYIILIQFDLIKLLLQCVDLSFYHTQFCTFIYVLLDGDKYV